MRRVAMIALTIAMAGAAVLSAQSTQVQAPAPATTKMQESLISTVDVSGIDSPLVRAAKSTIAARKRDASRSTGVLIDDAYMQTHQAGRISEAHGGAALPPMKFKPTQTQGEGVVDTPRVSTVDRAAVEKKIERLKNEQARAGAEMDEPYGGNNGMEEDKAEQRMTQIPHEIQQSQQQLNQHP
jgi:hypothetical protein